MAVTLVRVVVHMRMIVQVGPVRGGVVRLVVHIVAEFVVGRERAIGHEQSLRDGYKQLVRVCLIVGASARVRVRM